MIYIRRFIVECIHVQWFVHSYFSCVQLEILFTLQHPLAFATDLLRSETLLRLYFIWRQAVVQMSSLTFRPKFVNCSLVDGKRSALSRSMFVAKRVYI
jgi:hypothetical protein